MITVFTSSYNHGEFLSEAIESVLNQTYTNFEYILISDGAKDNTLDIMNSFAKLDSRIRVIDLPKQKNKSPLLNMSVDLSNRDYWTWMPADDIWYPNLLERKIETSKEYPNHVIYHSYEIIDQKGNLKKITRIPFYTNEHLYELVWTTSPLAFTGIWIPTYILRKLPFPDEDISEDYQWLIEATMNNIKFVGIPDILHKKRKHDKSVTAQKLKVIAANTARIRQELRIKYDK